MTSKGGPERLPRRGIERAARALYDVVTTAVYPAIPGTSVIDKALALLLGRDRRYPGREALLRFGKEVGHVKRPQQVLERIAEAMQSTWREYASLFPNEFAARVHAEWAESLKIAIETSGVDDAQTMSAHGSEAVSPAESSASVRDRSLSDGADTQVHPATYPARLSCSPVGTTRPQMLYVAQSRFDHGCPLRGRKLTSPQRR